MSLVDFGVTDSRRTYAETDLCSQAGAAELKRRIEEYWKNRGAVVEVKLWEAGFNAAMRSCRFDLRSDLVNGFPQGFEKSS